MFTTGNFSSLTGLKNSVQTALENAGWAVDTNIDVFMKNDMYFKLVPADGSGLGSLMLTAGTGIDGMGLTGIAPSGVKLGNPSTATINYPGTYDLYIFTDPDEVYLVINYNADRYQIMAFGKSDVEQVGGIGAWFTASFQGSAPMGNVLPIYLNTSDTSIGTWGGTFTLGMFLETTNSSNTASYIHTALDTTGWKSTGGSADGSIVGAADQVAGLLHALPSQFNQNTILLPLNITQRRLSQGQTIAASMKNARLCRIDNHLPGEIVDFGGEQWKVYPWHRKNADVRNGVAWNTGSQYSGTFGYAIRYEA